MLPRYRNLVSVLVPYLDITEAEARTIFGFQDSVENFVSGKTAISPECRERLILVADISFQLRTLALLQMKPTYKNVRKSIQLDLREMALDEFDNQSVLVMIQKDTKSLKWVRSVLGECLCWIG